MWRAFTIIENGLGISLEYLVLILIFLSGVILASRSFKLSVIWWFLSSGVAFIGFYGWGQSDPSVNWGLHLAFFFVSFVVMALTLYSINKTGVNNGGVF